MNDIFICVYLCTYIYEKIQQAHENLSINGLRF